MTISALPSRVGLCVIEKVNARVVGDRHQFLSRLFADLLRKRDPGAKGKLAHLQSRFPQADDISSGMLPS